MSLIQSLPAGPLDIVGDIHGEFDALQALLQHLGYNAHGQHQDGRTLVFVGDFCDRGPDSPAVLALVQQLLEAGRAVAVLGNHEVNLLREDVKDGSGWFFDARMDKDNSKYAPYNRPTPAERIQIVKFLSSLPIEMERNDLRVIHAAWCPDEIAIARTLSVGSVRENYDAWENESKRLATENLIEQPVDVKTVVA
jgi:predicted MPP superfamily phosphohydrolase